MTFISYYVLVLNLKSSYSIKYLHNFYKSISFSILKGKSRNIYVISSIDKYN